MEVNYQERWQAFADFKKDIEDRLAQWLKDHPVQKLLTDVRTRVVVVPDRTGAWVVLLNGVEKRTFYGDHAHAEATSYANWLINGEA